MKSAQHPGTVSARAMARILGVPEHRMRFGARMEWVPCKWTKGHRAKFDPHEVVEHLGACPQLFKQLRPSLDCADIPVAANWAIDAMTMGLRGVPALPSSIALALYFWGRRSEENKDILIRFLLSRGFTRYLRFQAAEPTDGDGESVRDDFVAMLDQLEREGLSYRRRAARQAHAAIRRETAEPKRDRHFDECTLVSADEMSHILGAPMGHFEEMACGKSTLSVYAGRPNRYCVEEVIQFILEHDLPFPPETGNGSPKEAWQWAGEARYRIQDQPAAPSRLAWRIWLWARWSPEGEARLRRDYCRRAFREASRELMRKPSARRAQ